MEEDLQFKNRKSTPIYFGCVGHDLTGTGSPTYCCLSIIRVLKFQMCFGFTVKSNSETQVHVC